MTDPPYELGFLGKAWDTSGIAWSCGRSACASSSRAGAWPRSARLAPTTAWPSPWRTPDSRSATPGFPVWQGNSYCSDRELSQGMTCSGCCRAASNCSGLALARERRMRTASSNRGQALRPPPTIGGTDYAGIGRGWAGRRPGWPRRGSGGCGRLLRLRPGPLPPGPPLAAGWTGCTAIRRAYGHRHAQPIIAASKAKWEALAPTGSRAGPQALARPPAYRPGPQKPSRSLLHTASESS